MKTIDHLINKNVYYLGNNYEYFKHISRFFAMQRSKSVFISDKKEAIASIDRELGNMRATSYAYHVDFKDQDKYLKTLNRVIKSRDAADIVLLSFKPEFESSQEEGESKNQLIYTTEDTVDLMNTYYLSNAIKSINHFLEQFIENGSGILVAFTTDSSTNPLERLFTNYINSYILSLQEELKAEGHSQILFKVVTKKSNVSYDRFVAKLTKALTSPKSSITI